MVNNLNFTICLILMTTIHQISKELFEDSFDLIALHCNMECFALAYHINRVAETLLVRAGEDLEISGFSHPLFEYKNDCKGEIWTLVSNIAKREESEHNNGLFQNSTILKLNYLLKQQKQINFILKISSEMAVDINQIINLARSIPKVHMAYQINTNKLRYKRNILF